MLEPSRKSEFIRQVQAHQGLIHKIAHVYGVNVADREDISQEIWLQLWRSYPSFAGRSEFSTWMYRVALNTAMTFRRKWKDTEEIGEDLWEYGGQAKRAEMSDDLRLLYRTISRLKPVDKAIIMQWLDDRSYEQIGETLGLSAKNISVRLVRIRARLTEIMKAEQ